VSLGGTRVSSSDQKSVYSNEVQDLIP